MKVFQETDPGTGKASLRQHPVQGFTWSDFTAKPGHDYTYRAVALEGKPTDLQEGADVSVEVATEVESNGTQAVWFDRGAAASQEHTHRFNHRRPDEVGAAAFAWLSRGLWEAMRAFVAQAKDARFGLRVAAYELNYGPVLAALEAASLAGADVQIIYDPRKPNPAQGNRGAVNAAGIDDLCRERTSNPSAITHNKFIVLLEDDRPISIWTGSTNFSEGGILGHSNVGHEVRNAEPEGRSGSRGDPASRFVMKSPKQRRREIQARRLQRAERKARCVNVRPVDRPVGTVVVTSTLLRSTTSGLTHKF